MYDEPYAAWRLEIENSDLCNLPSDFYSRLANYLRHSKEDNKEIDPNSLDSRLLELELANVAHLARELVSSRYRKIVRLLVTGNKVPWDSLVDEEQLLVRGFAPPAETYNKFLSETLKGQPSQTNWAKTKQISDACQPHNRTTLRFIKPVPSIIGIDMKSYGPFAPEDVASIPMENAKLLVKQGLAKTVEIQ